jgi:hypothetical protein
MVDIYFGVLTPTQVMMMLAGHAPPIPKTVVDEVKKVLVDKEKVMTVKDIKVLERAVGMYKDYEHGKLKSVSGKDIDSLLEESKVYTKKMKEVRDKLEKRKTPHPRATPPRLAESNFLSVTLESRLRALPGKLKTAALTTGVYLVSTLGGNYARAAPDPVTECAKPNVTCVDNTGNWRLNVQNALDSGNNVYLTDGDLQTEELYQVPFESTPGIYLVNNNRQVYGEGVNNTTLKRGSPFGNLFIMRAQNNKISDLSMEGGETQVGIDGDNYNNITIDSVSGKDISLQYVVFVRSDNPGNSAPNINIANSVFDGGKLVIHFSDMGFPELVSVDTKYVGIENCLFKNIRDNGNGLVIDSPKVWGTDIFLGSDDINNSTMIDSDNNWTEEFLMSQGSHGGGGVASVTYATLPGPSNMVEWDILGDTLADRGIGENNIEADPMLNKWSKAMPGSPAIPLRSGIGRAGDSNEDWLITLEDVLGFRDAYFLPSPSKQALSIYDINGDDLIDFTDYNLMMSDFSGLQPDCDGNGIGELEEILTEQDLADFSVVTPLSAEPNPILKNRYVSFTPPADGSSIRVTVSGLQGDYAYMNGNSWWVGEPTDVSENSGNIQTTSGFPDFKASRLQCTSFSGPWGTETIHAFGPEVIPGGQYTFQTISDVCDTDVEGNYSTPLNVGTAKWGDSVGNFNGTFWENPDGSVGIVTDVIAGLNKFSNSLGAPSKTRTDLEPSIPDGRINIADILQNLKAFTGLPYTLQPLPTLCTTQ